uniref:Reelin domain-containing protein n=1 Tax=Clastoptera arizonana TaxID=38151 RepID=A0A1B6CRD1_9HEMI
MEIFHKYTTLAYLILFIPIHNIDSYKRNNAKKTFIKKPTRVEICNSLNPVFGISGQNRTFPYDLIINPQNPYIGDKVTLTIKGTNSKDKLGGFLVQVRPDFNIPFGKFSPADNPKDAKIINCVSQLTTITHGKFNHRDLVSLTWTPPPTYTGPAVFFVTIIKARKVIWVAIKSEPFWYLKSK